MNSNRRSPLVNYIRKKRKKISYISEQSKWDIKLWHKNVIFLGPWMGEVGPELQYWIPYLNNLYFSRYLGNRHIIAVSRGGVKSWYKSLTGNYLEIYDYISLDEFKKIREESIHKGKVQKQIYYTEGEQALIRMIAQKEGIKDYAVIHPSLMWKEIIPWLREKITLGQVMGKLTFRKFSDPSREVFEFVEKLNLPKQFVAVMFYTNDLFSENQKNKNLVSEVIGYIARKFNVVLLGFNSHADDHKLIRLKNISNIVDISPLLQFQSNLAVQTEILRRSIGLIGTNGGFSVLPAFLNKPCLSFYERPLKEYLKLHLQHETVTEKVYEMMNNNHYSVVSTDSWNYIINLFIQKE